MSKGQRFPRDMAGRAIDLVPRAVSDFPCPCRSESQYDYPGEDEEEEEEILGSDDDEQEDPKDYCKGGPPRLLGTLRP